MKAPRHTGGWENFPIAPLVNRSAEQAKEMARRSDARPLFDGTGQSSSCIECGSCYVVNIKENQ
jgi:succinate dehydrogenase/fumarate reductase-like Fe-S protein